MGGIGPRGEVYLKHGLILQGGGYVDALALLLAVGGALAILPLVIAQEA